MRALITGANGFVGSSLAKRLNKMGWDVRGFVRRTSDLQFLEGLDKIELVFGDLSNFAVLKRAMESVDMVFHTAALTSDWGDFDLFYEINVKGTENVVLAAIDANVKRFVYISSVSACGFGGKVEFKEDMPVSETKYPYCITKLEAENVVKKYIYLKKFPAIIIRPGIIYGPNDRVTLPKIAKVLESGFLFLIDHGKYLMCPTYIDNLIDGIILAIKSKKAIGNTYNITDGIDCTWEEYFRLVTNELKINPIRLSLPANLAFMVATGLETFYTLFKIKQRPFITKYVVDLASNDFSFSIEKAKSDLGYKPKIRLKEGIRKAIQWYRNYWQKK